MAYVIFLVFNPYLWLKPIDGIVRLYQFRAAAMQAQADEFPAVAITSRLDAVRVTWTQLSDGYSGMGRILPERYLAEAGIQANINLAGIDIVLALLGFIALAFMASRHGWRSTYTAVLLVLGTQAAIIRLTIRVDWARYYLPVVLLMAVTIGLACGMAPALIRAFGRILARIPGLSTGKPNLAFKPGPVATSLLLGPTRSSDSSTAYFSSADDA